MILGITGKYCSGKDTAAALLMEKGFFHISLSDIIREEAAKRNILTTRENLIFLGNELRKNFGAGILAQRALEKIGENGVITSIRNPGEVDVLRTRKDFVLISIDAPELVRWKRMQERPDRPDNLKTLEEFRHREMVESTSTNPAHIRLNAVMGMADVVICNDGSLGELKKKMYEII